MSLLHVAPSSDFPFACRSVRPIFQLCALISVHCNRRERKTIAFEDVEERRILENAYEAAQDGPADRPASYDDKDGLATRNNTNIKYKTLSWQFVAVLMIAEIVSNGMLSFPSSLAVVGMVSELVFIIFLGVFATYTSLLLVNFELRDYMGHLQIIEYTCLSPVGQQKVEVT